ncbi:hypothetical protein C8J57DRAFT_1624811 [Mycena rebaudengoi]|nr:hypothetical protein C8J57DRAFT_1624811 [Mycena rebaudengoi]
MNNLLSAADGTRRRTRTINERPNKYTHRVEWNAHFAREISRRYDSFSFTEVPIVQRSDRAWTWETSDITELNLRIADLAKRVMHNEGRIVSLAVENLLYGSFETDWKQPDLQKKEEIVLEGLYRGACASTRENSRDTCPEMTIKGLVGDGKFNSINLLKCLLEHSSIGNGRVKQIYFFIHPYVEHQHRCSEDTPDLVKAFIYRLLLFRNCVITATLIGILDAYLDIPAEQHPVAKTWNRCEEQATCATAQERETFKRCNNCRPVWYCSKECQRKDWIDHKKICGQQHFDLESLTPTPEDPPEFIGCPSVVNGFNRTPALWRQFWYLSKADSQHRDYHFDTAPKKTRSVRILHPPGGSCRDLLQQQLTDRLLTQRNSSSSSLVVALWNQILEYQEKDGLHNLTIDQIHAQFEREYRVTITPSTIEAAGPFAPPTWQELAEEESYRLQRLSSVEN